LSNEQFRAYTSTDVIGVELGGSLKNVIAIAAGISDGLDLGLNARSAIITRGLAEITRLGIKIGGKVETFMGLSGIGDLVLTCTGDLSRNRTVGKRLARGETLDEITKSMRGIAEGVYTVKAAKYLQIFYQVEMPITEEIYKVLYENKSIFEAIMDLMNRPLRSETI
jgi:glycerol-3-phosphate dehydrogenase (NAD(P)+)